MSLKRAVVLQRSGVTLFALWTFFACGGRDNAEIYTDDGGLIGACGNGQVDPGEQCDGDERGEVKDCADALGNPRATGTLRCSEHCVLIVSDCHGGGSGGSGSGGRNQGGGGGGGTFGGGGRNNGGTFGGGGQNGGGTFGGGGRTGGGGQNGGGTFGGGGRTGGAGQNGGGTFGGGGRRGGGGGRAGAPAAGGAEPVDSGTTDSGAVDAGPPCNASADCANNEVCCGTISGGQYTGFACSASCGTADTVVDCDGPSDCSNGQVCCGVIQQTNPPHYGSITCQTTCNQAQNEYVQCASNADCTTGTCQTSTLLPARFRVCR